MQINVHIQVVMISKIFVDNGFIFNILNFNWSLPHILTSDPTPAGGEWGRQRKVLSKYFISNFSLMSCYSANIFFNLPLHLL